MEMRQNKPVFKQFADALTDRFKLDTLALM